MTEAGRREKEKHVEDQVGLQCRKKHTNTLTVNKDKHEGVHTNTLTVNKDKQEGHQSTSVHAVLMLFSEKAKPMQI